MPDLSYREENAVSAAMARKIIGAVENEFPVEDFLSILEDVPNQGMSVVFSIVCVEP